MMCQQSKVGWGECSNALRIAWLVKNVPVCKCVILKIRRQCPQIETNFYLVCTIPHKKQLMKFLKKKKLLHSFEKLVTFHFHQCFDPFRDSLCCQYQKYRPACRKETLRNDDLHSRSHVLSQHLSNHFAFPDYGRCFRCRPSSLRQFLLWTITETISAATSVLPQLPHAYRCRTCERFQLHFKPANMRTALISDASLTAAHASMYPAWSESNVTFLIRTTAISMPYSFPSIRTCEFQKMDWGLKTTHLPN